MVLRAEFLEAMYENKLEFPGGRGGAKRKPSVGGVWIFPGTAQFMQIFLTHLHTFSYSISWDNLLKDQNDSPLVIILSILITCSLYSGVYAWIL